MTSVSEAQQQKLYKQKNRLKAVVPSSDVLQIEALQ
jgi:hypothetical protein